MMKDKEKKTTSDLPCPLVVLLMIHNLFEGRRDSRRDMPGNLNLFFLIVVEERVGLSL